MESKNVKNISVDIPNYNGPLEVLLELAKSQKVDLAEISITKLADQFLAFIKNQEDLNYYYLTKMKMILKLWKLLKN